MARLGGDEFAVLVEDIHDVPAPSARRGASTTICWCPFDIGAHEIFTTVSIGIAVSTSGYARPEDVLRDADIAMYRAKARGKARHEVFDAAMHARAVELLQFETDLRRAIERGELRVHYQPIVSLRTGEVHGFEALVRWQRGAELVGADEIVAMAEETGLIVPIGDWVLREACGSCARGMSAASATARWTMHVNLSARQLLQPDVVERIRARAATTAASRRSGCIWR